MQNFFCTCRFVSAAKTIGMLADFFPQQNRKFLIVIVKILKLWSDGGDVGHALGQINIGFVQL
jgi:hypothetical protein